MSGVTLLDYARMTMDAANTREMGEPLMKDDCRIMSPILRHDLLRLARAYYRAYIGLDETGEA